MNLARVMHAWLGSALSVGRPSTPATSCPRGAPETAKAPEPGFRRHLCPDEPWHCRAASENRTPDLFITSAERARATDRVFSRVHACALAALGLIVFIWLRVKTKVLSASLAATARLYSVAIVAVQVRFQRLFLQTHRQSCLIGQAEQVMTCELSTTQTLNNWTVAMTAQSLSPNTIRERVRVITQVEAQTQTNPLTLSPADITMWLATLTTPTTRHCY